jgi:hypothetical protein
MGFSRTALALAAAIVVVAPAQAQNTTAAVNGRITAPDGSPVAGAAVTIVHVESGSTSNVVTDAQGRYSARGLRAGGPYTVTISKDGRTERRDNVFLALAETFALDATLGQTQTITVTGRGANDRFNSSAMGAGTNIGSRELATYASIGRSLQDYARTDPRLAQTDKERGEVSAGGQNTRYNSITIDGVTINDTFGLEPNNLPTIKQPISIDAIQAVQVNLSNYDVTQRGYTGANTNAVTKSGTNSFRGSLYYVYRDEDLVGKRYNRTNGSYFDAPAFEETLAGFTLGGPIVKDKLFFFASYEELKSSRESPTFGPLGSTLTNVGITPAAITSAQNIARNTWGLDIGTSDVPQGLQVVVKDTLLKLDWNISDQHRANLRYTKTEQEEPQLNGFSTTGLSLSSYWFNQAKTLETVVGQWFADWTDTFSTELKFSQRDYDSRPVLLAARMPAIGLRFEGSLPAGAPNGVSANNRFLNFGTENSRHFNVLETKTTDVYAGATWNLGAHELKFGADYAKNEVFNAFLQNIYGNYTFACEPGSYSFGTIGSAAGAVAANCNAATPAQREAAVLENFQRGLPSSYTLQTALAGRTVNDAVAIWEYENIGLFVQDTFKVTPSFNVMFGVRFDQQKVPSRPIFNAAAAAPRVAGSVTGATSVQRDTGGFGMDNTVTLDNSELVQPRVGFNWNLGNNERRMQLRGGFGLFQGAAANVWLSNPFSNTGAAVTTFSCTTFQACNGNSASSDAIAARFRANPDAQVAPPGTPPSPNIDFLSPNLEQPSVWKANLAFEAELPALPVVGRLVASAEWLHTDVKSSIYYRHLNLGDATRTGPDGRQLFWMPQTYNPACWSGQTFVTTGACSGGRDRALSNASWGRNVLLAEKTSQGGGDAITVGVQSPTGPAGFGWSLYYTRTTAKEVSPLTSSTSSSNWSNRSIFNPNEEVLQNSNYLTKDRVSGSLNWSKAFFGTYRTTVGMFYEGRRGKPYSWTYINDLNGDGISGNDLMYIPSGPGSGEVEFRGGAAEEARFWEIVEANPALAAAKGGIVGRNNSYAPWVNNIDLRISQELPGFMKGHKTTFTLDILNFGNLLNKRWGRIDEIGFPSNRSFVNFNGINAQGRYVYALGTYEDFVTRQTRGESQWAVQATLRYEF